jgi:hypothetical protein
LEIFETAIPKVETSQHLWALLSMT